MTGQRRVSEAELHAFVDGELTPDERAEIEAMLVAAPSEHALAHEFRDLNEAIRVRYAGRLKEPVPPVMRKLAVRLGRGGFPVGRQLGRLAAAALVILAAGAAGYTLRDLISEPRAPDVAFVTTALAAHTVYVPEVRHPVEVKADEAHLVRWLTKRVGAEVRAPSLVELGWKLMGGRLLPDHGVAAAQFMYEDASGRRLTLYMRRESGLNNTSFRFFEKDGFGSFYWIDRPLAYALSGRLTRDELMNLANVVYAQIEAGSRAPAEPRPGQ
jgi:anti-sigma factor RsiW